MNGKFIINNTICFDADNYTVTVVKNNECRCLAGVKGRCLLLLLEGKDNEVTTKKQLHFAVWEKFGFYSNDNCLLQTIYSLRKELKQLGLEDMILTSPRVGYKINPSYNINVISNNKYPIDEFFIEESDYCFSQSDTEPPQRNMSVEEKLTIPYPPPSLMKKTVVALIFAIVLMILSYSTFKTHDIYFLGSQEKLSQLEKLDSVNGLITEEYLQKCKQSDIESGIDADVFICNSNFKNIKKVH